MMEKSELAKFSSQNEKGQEEKQRDASLLSELSNHIALPVGQENVSDVHLPVKREQRRSAVNH